MASERLTAERWNATVPVGTAVRYWPVAGEGAHENTKTRSEAWDLGDGEAVVKVEGRPGGVSLRHLCVLDWTADDEAAYLDREAAGFPVEHYEDPPFTPVAASQFVSGYQAAKSAIEADR